MTRCSHPTVLIDRAVAFGLEILDPMTLGSRLIGKRLDQADAVQWYLPHPIYDVGKLDTGRLIQCGGDVIDVGKLGPQATPIFDARWPGNDEGISCSSEMRGHMLHSLEGRAAHPGPSRAVI